MQRRLLRLPVKWTTLLFDGDKIRVERERERGHSAAAPLSTTHESYAGAGGAIVVSCPKLFVSCDPAERPAYFAKTRT